MKLYQSLGPNPRIVTMFIAEKGLSIKREFLDIIAGENRRPPYSDINPYGQTPMLELDNGTRITESAAICQYLEELHPAPSLLGETPEERAKTRMFMRRIDLEVIVPMATGFRAAEGYEMFKTRMRCVPEAADGLKAVARDGLARLEKVYSGGPWLTGERFTLADIELYCFLDFGAQVGQKLPSDLSKLNAWRERAANRPSAAISADPQNGL